MKRPPVDQNARQRPKGRLYAPVRTRRAKKTTTQQDIDRVEQSRKSRQLARDLDDSVRALPPAPAGGRPQQLRKRKTNQALYGVATEASLPEGARHTS